MSALAINRIPAALAGATVLAGLAFASPGDAMAATHGKHLQKWRSDHGKGNYVCHRHTKKIHGHRVHCLYRPKHVARPKAHTAVGSSQYVLPAYIVRCESGGNPRAVNHSNPTRPAGLYQIITSTWLGYGGGKYAPTADQATPYEQGIIALKVKAGQGMGAWECA